ncbi:hypothetical protein EZV62_007533 [Acer yangbiense]|uniref:NAC domain-containing protein n=1 Tax=Acer yangbiense TaxID=1000413 RepID=A0A5C7IAU0_9ROSI|nr:hypothetical protein EZV62_007533 [Acer yangbiense]
MEEASNMNSKVEELIDLPPGFRFHPTDEEIITYYLTEKVVKSSFDACAIGEEEWVVCRVFHKSTGMKKNPISEFVRIEDDFFDYSTLPPLMDTPPSNYSNRPSSSFSAADDDGDNQFNFKHINNNNYQPTNINNNNNNNFLVQPSSNFQPQIPLFSGGYQTRGLNNNPAGYLHQGIMSSSSIDQAILQLQAAAAAANNNNNSNNDQQSMVKWDHIGQQQCKVEQLSSNNQSMISQSQDTGLSSDMNTTEISSKQVVNNNNMGGGSSSIDTINIDLDNFWGNF